MKLSGLSRFSFPFLTFFQQVRKTQRSTGNSQSRKETCVKPPPPITGSHAEDTLQLFESLIDDKLMITITENMRRNLINAVFKNRRCRWQGSAPVRIMERLVS